MHVMDLPRSKVRTSFGESKIEVPRDRDASFNPDVGSQTQEHG